MNRHRALASCLSMISAQTLCVCREGKPGPTFPDHALSASDPRAPDPDVERALPAMADMGFLEADHQRPEFRQAQPLRHLAAEHAALRLCSHLALAGDDEHEGQPLMMRALQKSEQGVMGADLRHAVKIEPGIDLVP